ncbi:MAG: hypothetical protein R2795_05580 [Saprospiraceae bacterium]
MTLQFGNGADTNGNGGIGSEDNDGTRDPDDEDDGDDASITPPCMLVADYEVNACNDNGTPSNPNDDYFTVTVQIDGTNTSGSWTAEDNRGQIRWCHWRQLYLWALQHSRP